MNKQEIEKYLLLVGQELQTQGITLDLLLLGGAAMLIEVGNRESTQDVDTYFVSNAAALLRASAKVAQREQLPDGWLNTAAAGFTYNFIKKPDMVSWKVFSGLHVYLPSLDYLFVTKVMAGRRKDDEDIKALARRLHISTVKDAVEVVRQYVADTDISNESLQAIQRCFSQ